MCHPTEEALARALRDASDPAGVGRLLGVLGYRLIEPPDGVELADPVGARRVATGGGVEAVLLPLELDAGDVTRADRVRTALGSVPRPVLILAPFDASLAVATGGLDGKPRMLVLSRAAPTPHELDTLAELAPRDDGALGALSRHARALDRSTITRRFFRDFRARRAAVADAWTGIPRAARADREQIGLLLLSRIVFLYFLQKQGHLLGRDDYLIDLIRNASLERGAGSIYRRRLVPLFFGVLNRLPDARDADARRLGALPYLNGGLFEAHAIERAHPDLDLPDDVVIGIFEGFFERYRFAGSEARRGDSFTPAGIHPEMLGRMFEGLMSPLQRERTGTFYTPGPIVDRIVRSALQGWLSGRDGMDWRAAGMLLRERSPSYGPPALLSEVRTLRVLDPACGSGAFVLGALDRIARLRASLGDRASAAEVRRDLASKALHGVDLEADAALLCALRLWLALTPADGPDGGVQPLPNLDQRVRQGDALLDPLDLTARGDATAEAWRAAAYDPGVRRARRCLAGLVAMYGPASADARPGLRARIGRAEVRLARRWIGAALQRLDVTRRRHHESVRTRDLFGDRARTRTSRDERVRVRDARSELKRLQHRLRDDGSLPFFSFALHFSSEEGSGGRFDLVVSNPPWIRSHRWPRTFAQLMRARFKVCSAGSWAPSGSARGRAGQVDLALLFLERGLELLRPGGVLALLLPSKSFRSLSAGGARALVHGDAQVLAIEDHGLDHRGVFRNVDAFAGLIVARNAPTQNGSAKADPVVRVTMTHAASPPLRFSVARRLLPLDPHDPRSPWLLAPPDVRRALRTMQRNGRALGIDPELTVRRGAMTGANDALLFERAERRLGDAVVAWRADASGAAQTSWLLHTGDLCPLVRGSGIRPFRFDTEGFVAWCHDDDSAAPRPASRRLMRALAPVQARLRARPGWRADLADGILFRLDSSMLRPRVAWRDIAPDLETVRLPARVHSLGCARPLIVLNTVYFIAVAEDVVASSLSALLGSLPCRVFARAIAERAKDAHFRFLGWTVAALPLPVAWKQSDTLEHLARLGEQAHADAHVGAVDPATRAEIDRVAAELFGLNASSLDALQRFDGWLAGKRSSNSG